MYNGIGLPTPRGSGTSGYVQRNLSYVRPRRSDFEQAAKKQLGNKPPKIRKVNAQLAEHEKKRQIEIQVLKYLDSLKEKQENLSEEELEKLTQSYREKLKSENKTPPKEMIETHNERAEKLKSEFSKEFSTFPKNTKHPKSRK